MATLGHIVTKTDTLERLSRFYKVPICMILRANEGGRGLLPRAAHCHSVSQLLLGKGREPGRGV